MLYMVFDVESVGLHGEGFAVGWVVVGHHGTERACGYVACPSERAAGEAAGRAWVQENVLQHLPGPTCAFPENVREAFWAAWMGWKAQGAVLVADCGWPVEARFLLDCVRHAPEEREWQGPYPLHDVATARLAVGYDSLETCKRLPTEEPAHHPTADARQSARLFVEALEDCAL